RSRFCRTTGTQILPATTSGSPSGAAGIGAFAATLLVAGSIRTSLPGAVIQMASLDAAVHCAEGIGTVAIFLLVRGSTRATPSVPATQTEPKAATTPTGAVTGIRATTRFFVGSMRSSWLPLFAVAQAEPKAKVVSYGVAPTRIAAVRLPFVTDT